MPPSQSLISITHSLPPGKCRYIFKGVFRFEYPIWTSAPLGDRFGCTCWHKEFLAIRNKRMYIDPVSSDFGDDAMDKAKRIIEKNVFRRSLLRRATDWLGLTDRRERWRDVDWGFPVGPDDTREEVLEKWKARVESGEIKLVSM